MTKRKLFPAAVDGYKQTDISTYFKVKNNISWGPRMKTEQCSTNKENSEELSPPKKPKPLCSSDDDNESVDVEGIIDSLLAPLKESVKTPKPVLREHQPPQQPSVKKISKLPLQLPTYTYSEDSDSEVHNDDKTASQPEDARKLRRSKKRIKKNLDPALFQLPNNKNVAITPELKKDLNIMPVVISSDEDDFEITPRKIKKVDASLLTGRKLTAKETAIKVEEFLARSSYSKMHKTVYQSGTNINTNKQEKKNLEDAETVSGYSSKPSTSKTTSIISSQTIGVHKPTTVSTISAKPKPRILQTKSISNSNLSSTSAEFISTDFSSRAALDVLSASVQSISSNDTIVYEQNFTIGGNVNSTPKKVKVFERIVINSPKGTLEECNFSPIKKDAISTTEPTASSSQLINMARGNLSRLTEEETENGNWTTRLFTKIVKYVQAHSHLKTMLTCVEVEMLERLYSMPQTDYHFFCFKLFTRIQKWYNIFKLRNDLHMELSDPEMRNMYDCLYENKFVEIDFSSEPCIDLLNNLSSKDLKEICETFKIKLTKERKCEIVQKLLTNCNRQTTLTMTKSLEKILRDRIKQKMGICVKLSPDLYKLFAKVHLLYSFTTSDFDKPSDLHFFLGKIMSKEISIPKFSINMNVKIFSSISQFSRFAEACECKRAMVESFEKKEIGHMLELSELAHSELKEILECYEEPKPSYLMRFTAGYKYTKALSLGAKHLARHYPAKVEQWLIYLIEQDHYCLKFRGCWYDLLVMVQYNYLKQYETAANTLIEALDRKDLLEVHLQDLSYRAEAIKRSKAHKIAGLLHDNICFVQPPSLREFPFIEIDAQAIRDETGRKGKRLYMEKTEEAQHLMTVEEIALKHYYKNGYINGLHCEGSLLETIFFVLFWDIIYQSAVPDAFILEMQYFPLDLWSQEFYTNRKAAIDQRLDEIRSKWPNDQLKGFVCNVWDEHSHEKSYINNRLINESKDLFDIILCIGRVKLARILERIAKDFKAYHSGLPDLFLWTVQKKQCKFVEVKGEKDKLSSKQKLWLDFLLSVGADAEVCHVHTVGSKTGRKVRRIKKEVKKQEKNVPQ